MKINYLVYEIVDKKWHEIAICEDLSDAKCVATALASVDPSGDEYHVTSIANDNDFVPGGGWRYTFQKDKGTGEVVMSEIS